MKLDICDEATVAKITFPDFLGNFHFNTLGNLLANPKAGLLFVDFATGTTLHVWGLASIIWEGQEVRLLALCMRQVDNCHPR